MYKINKKIMNQSCFLLILCYIFVSIVKNSGKEAGVGVIL